MKEIVQDGLPNGKAGAEVLHEVAQPVPEELFGSAELERLLADMAETLDREPDGVALAAPQVGVPYRLFIVRTDRAVMLPNGQGSTSVASPKPEVEVYLNPEIIKTSRKRAEVDEGCLSLRDLYGTTKRHERVTIRACRPDGSTFTRGAGGLMAQIFEHEMDHLNGVLFTEHADHLIRIVQSHEPKS